MWFYVCHFSTLRCLVFKGGSKKNCWMCENLKSLWPEDSSSSFKVKQSMTRRQIFSFVLYLHSGKLCYMGKISRENPLENGSHEKMRRHAQFHTSFMLQNPSLRMRPSELFFKIYESFWANWTFWWSQKFPKAFSSALSKDWTFARNLSTYKSWRKIEGCSIIEKKGSNQKMDQKSSSPKI